MKQNELMGAIKAARKSMVLGDVPQDLLQVVCDAMDVVRPNLGPSLPPELGANIICLIAMELAGTIIGAADYVEATSPTNS